MVENAPNSKVPIGQYQAWRLMHSFRSSMSRSGPSASAAFVPSTLRGRQFPTLTACGPRIVQATKGEKGMQSGAQARMVERTSSVWRLQRFKYCRSGQSGSLVPDLGGSSCLICQNAR